MSGQVSGQGGGGGGGRARVRIWGGELVPPRRRFVSTGLGLVVEGEAVSFESERFVSTGLGLVVEGEAVVS